MLRTDAVRQRDGKEIKRCSRRVASEKGFDGVTRFARGRQGEKSGTGAQRGISHRGQGAHRGVTDHVSITAFPCHSVINKAMNF